LKLGDKVMSELLISSFSLKKILKEYIEFPNTTSSQTNHLLISQMSPVVYSRIEDSLFLKFKEFTISDFQLKLTEVSL
jgi:hypothetical protein